MRKISKAVLAAGMAAATIASGLSFGAAAASAADVIHPTPNTFQAKLVFPVPANGKTFSAVTGVRQPTGITTVTETTTKAAALEAAAELTLPKVNEIGTITRPDGACLSQLGWASWEDPSVCEADAPPLTSLWTVHSDGTIWNAGTQWPLSVQWSSTFGQKSITTVPTATPTAPNVDPVFEDNLRQFTAEVESVDVSSRSAEIRGTGTSGAKVRINGDTVDVHSDGVWKYIATDLKLGDTKLTAEQFVDGESTGTTEVTVSLSVQALSAAVNWNAADARKEADVIGTAEKSADIVVRNADGDEIGSGMASKSDGSFSIPVAAPNAAGDAAITVSQVIGGDVYDSKDLTVEYGAAVDITSPAAGSEHDGGALKLTGTGESGAKVIVTEQGQTMELASGDVLGGSWDLKASLDASEHVLEVKQIGKGNNVTTDTITINPGKGTVQNGGFTAAGVGTAASVEQGKKTDAYVGLTADNAVSEMNGTQITLDAPAGTTFTAGQTTLQGQTRTSDSGTWTTDAGLTVTGEVKDNGKRFVGTMADTDNGFSLTKGAGLRWKSELTAAKDAPIATKDLEFSVTGTTNHGSFSATGKSPVTITASTDLPAPTNLAVVFDVSVFAKGKVTGQGTANAAVEVLDGTKRVGSGTANADGSFSVTIDPQSAGKHTLTVKQTAGGKTSQDDVEADYGQTFAVTTPAKTTDSTKVHLSGVAPAGAQVSFKDNTGTTRMATANSAGAWEADGWFRPDTTTVALAAHSKGALVQRDSAPLDVNVTNRPITVVTPTMADAANDAITDGDVSFTGTATPFATVEFATWPGSEGRKLFTTYADENGNWKATGWLGKSYYKLVGTEYAIGGYTNQYSMFAFSTVAFANAVVVTPPVDGVVRSNELIRVSGTATPGSEITVVNGSTELGKATTAGDGAWTAWITFADKTTYDLVAQQTALNGRTSTTGIARFTTEGFHQLDKMVWTPSGQGNGTFTMRAQPGATVDVYSGPKEQSWARKIASGKADEFGLVSLPGYLTSNNAYQLKVYQTSAKGSQTADWNLTTPAN